MIKHILLTITLLGQTTLACQPGCLKCDPVSHSCLLCDTYNFYFPNGKVCTQSYLKNCILASGQGTCVFCKPGFYSKEGLCLPLARSKRIDGCLFYGSEKECARCSSEYRLEKGACFKIDIKNTLCLSPIDLAKCVDCSSLETYEEKQPCPLIKSEGQLSYEETGFAFNQTHTLPKTLETTLRKSIDFQDFMFTILSKKLLNLPLEIHRSTTSKCQHLSAESGLCEKCVDGYTLDLKTGKCKLSAGHMIANCRRLVNKEACLECDEGYYLYAPKVCLKMPETLKHCAQYDSASEQCHGCVAGYYLTNGQCIRRSKVIKNCDVYDNGSNLCVACKPGFILNSAKDDCLSAIPKCLGYVFETTGKSQRAKCFACQHPYLPDSKGKTCQVYEYQQQGCAAYDLKGMCISCSPGFYHLGNGCEKLPDIWNSMAIRPEPFIPFTNELIHFPKFEHGFFKSRITQAKTNRRHGHSYHRANLHKDKSADIKSQHAKQEDNHSSSENIPMTLSAPLSSNTCDQSSILVSKFAQCYPNRQNACVKESPQGKCLECSPNSYPNTQGICTKGSIPGCLNYSQTIGETVECIECRKEWILENSACRSAIPLFKRNCRNDISELCEQCEAGFFPLHFELSELTNSKKFTPASQSESRSNGLVNTLTNALEYLKKSFSKSNVSAFKICVAQTITAPSQKFKDCLQINISTNECDLCKEGFAKNIVTKICEPCNVFDETSAYCRANRQSVIDDHCVVKSEDGSCLQCQSNVASMNISSKVFTVRKYADRSRGLFIETPEYPKKCGVALSPICATDYCAEAFKTKGGDVCCRKCFMGKQGLNKANAFGEIFVQNCPANINFCNTSIIRGIKADIWNRLSCFSCEESHSLTISDFPGDSANHCRIIREAQYENCLIRDYEHCLYCKPTYTRKNGLCVKIENCEFSSTVEKCEECKAGFQTSEDGSACIKVQEDGCRETASENKCTSCFDGFVLVEGVCVELKLDSCKLRSRFGCEVCEPLPDGQLIMLKFTGELITTSTMSVNDSSKRRKSVCVTMPNSIRLNNCQEYESASSCSKCTENYLLMKKKDSSKKCVRITPQLINCSEVNERLECTDCSVGHYLDQNGKCSQGFIAFCQEYKSPSECSKCESDFFMSQTSAGIICIKTPAIQNCSTVSVKALSTPSAGNSFNRELFSLNCERCQENYYEIQLTPSQPVCLTILSENYCKNIDERTGYCKECLDGFYLKMPESNFLPGTIVTTSDSRLLSEPNTMTVDRPVARISKTWIKFSPETNPRSNLNIIVDKKGNNRPICSKRLNKTIEYCEKLSATSDACELCKSTHYLSSSGLKCVEAISPSLKGCLIMDNGKCTKCDKEYFFESGLCRRVEKPIIGCSIYQTDTQCAECAAGFSLNKLLLCEKPERLIANCEMYYNHRACKRCQPGYFLATSHACIKINTPINNCRHYMAKNQCSECQEPFILVQNACVAKEQANASNLRVFLNSSKAKAADGFAIRNPRNVNLEGCLFAIPEKNVCYICRIGWYQNSSLKCKRNVLGLRNLVKLDAIKSSLKTVARIAFVVGLFLILG
jgi:hypothetical protein